MPPLGRWRGRSQPKPGSPPFCVASDHCPLAWHGFCCLNLYRQARGGCMGGERAFSEQDGAAAAYQADGAIVLRGVFKDWVEPLRAGIEALMADPSPLERTVRPADGSAPFFQDLCNWQRIPQGCPRLRHRPTAPVTCRWSCRLSGGRRHHSPPPGSAAGQPARSLWPG